MDYMSQLLAIGEGGEAFFVSCLLHLSPEDLKASRLVNKTWNEVIKKKLWGNKRARKTLEEKLPQRWKTTNPDTVELSRAWCLGMLKFFSASCSARDVTHTKHYDEQKLKMDVFRTANKLGKKIFR